MKRSILQRGLTAVALALIVPFVIPLIALAQPKGPAKPAKPAPTASAGPSASSPAPQPSAAPVTPTASPTAPASAGGETEGPNPANRPESEEHFNRGMQLYNEEAWSPVDGELIKICDKLAAFIEASLSINHGIKSTHLEEGKKVIYAKFKDETLGGIVFKELFDYYN